MAELVVGIDTSEKLPEEYTRLEYIQLDHAYIDTGIVLDTAEKINTAKIHLTIANLPLSSGNTFAESGHSNHLFGIQETIGDVKKDLVFFTGVLNGSSTDNCYGMRFYTTQADQWLLSPSDSSQYPRLLNKYRYDVDNLQMSITDVDRGIVLGTYTADPVDFGCTNDFRINGQNRYPNTSEHDIWYGESYNIVRVYDLEIEGIAHMVPAKRNSDNVVGMYDMVRHQFYTATITVDRTGSVSGGYEYAPEVLPSGYTRLEYIENSRGQYIDTEFKLTSSYTRFDFYVKCSIDRGTVPDSNQEKNIFSNDGCVFGFISNPTQTVTATRSNTSAWNVKQGTLSSNADTVEVSGYFTSTEFYDNYITKFIGTNRPYENDKNFYLFKGRSNTNRPYAGKLYRLTFVVDNITQRDFIPAKRNSDDAIGLFDITNNVFYENAGTGSFVAGPEYEPATMTVYTRVPALVVEKGAPIKKYNLYDRVKDDSNNDIGIVTGFFTKNVEGHNLPSEYTELEYIESTGTQYIDTGINYQSTDTFELDFMVTDLSSSKHVVTNNRVDQTDAFFQIAQTSTLLLADINNDGSGTDIGRVSTNQITSLNNRIKVYIPDGKTVYMNNTLIGTAPNPLNTNSNTLRLFGSYISAESNIRIYSLKVGNKAYFIPAKRKSDSVLGMYDLASGTFFINSGSGTFTAGPYVIPENTEYAIVCLNAQYRIESGNSNATYCTSTVSNQKYYTTIEDVWNTTDTATEINDALYTEKSSAAKAIHYLRTNFSFTIEGNVYKPQVPNIPELYSILNNFTVINNSDPTASSYPAKTLKTGTELGAVPPNFPESRYGYRSCQFNGNWTTLSYWACGFIGYQGTYRKDGPSTGSDIYAFVVPVLELPNQIIG